MNWAAQPTDKRRFREERVFQAHVALYSEQSCFFALLEQQSNDVDPARWIPRGEQHSSGTLKKFSSIEQPSKSTTHLLRNLRQLLMYFYQLQQKSFLRIAFSTLALAKLFCATRIHIMSQDDVGANFAHTFLRHPRLRHMRWLLQGPPTITRRGIVFRSGRNAKARCGKKGLRPIIHQLARFSLQAQTAKQQDDHF